MKSALVTGASSFIGYEVVRHLTRTGTLTHVLVRPTTKTNRMEKLEEPPKIHITDGTCDSLYNILYDVNPEIIFHFASLYIRDERAEEINEMIKTNIELGTILLQAICQANKKGATIKGFINTGSYFQYYDNTKNAVNLYAASKSAFEQVLTYYHHRFNLPATTLVLFDVYGPRDWRIKLLPSIRDSQISQTKIDLPKNDMLLNMVHSDDVVDCFITAANKLLLSPEEVNMKCYAVRNAKNISISKIIKLFEKYGSHPIKVNWGGWNSPDRGIILPWNGPTLPGWKPTVSLKDGIRQLVEKPLNEN